MWSPLVYEVVQELIYFSLFFSFCIHSYCIHFNQYLQFLSLQWESYVGSHCGILCIDIVIVVLLWISVPRQMHLHLN